MRANPAFGLTLVLLQRTTMRHWRLAPGQSSLLVLILALGIAVFFSIRLANRAAVASFQNFTELITRESDWMIQAPAGWLPDAILPELRQRLGPRPVHVIPVLETTAARPPSEADAAIGSQETFQLLGLDLIGVQNLAARRAPDHSWFGQTNVAEPAGKTSFWEVFGNPRAVFISDALSRRDELGTGDTLSLVVNESVVVLEVAGIIPANADDPRAPPTLLVMDLPAVQALSGHPGRLSRVEFIVEAGPEAADRRTELRTLLEQWSGDRWQVSSPGARRDQAATMTRAFRMNLTILSLIALLVGLYLIFQALDGAVMRRREEIGILRSLGVEESQVRRVWLLEAALLGLVGGVLGALLGWAGAQLSVRLVGRTVNALYYSTSVSSARLDPGELLLARTMAVMAGLLAGWLPARAAARTPPAQILVRHALAPEGLLVWRREWLGVLLFCAGFLVVGMPPLHLEDGLRFPWAGYLAGLCWILGGGILGGGLLRFLGRMIRPWGSRWLVVRIAAGHLVRPSGRHRIAVAGLVCAVAMTAGMTILVASFDRTMNGWIERTFQADLYLSSSGAQSASTDNRISPDTWLQIGRHPGVEAMNVVQTSEIRLAGGSALLSGADLGVMRQRTRLAWLEPPLSEAVFDADRNAGLALVTESFGERFGVGRGDRITVPTPAGKKELTIAGVYSDYGNERGSVLVERRHFARWFGHEQASGLMVFVRSGVDPESLRGEWLTSHPGLRIFSNAHLRSEILRIFRQTFAITYALEVIGILVAVIGLGLTLVSVLLERRAELTTLRSLGVDRREIAHAAAAEGTMLALAGVAVGTGVSVALGWMLIYVVNKQTFGWTLGFVIPGEQLGLLAVLVTAMGALVAHATGRWGARLPADREE